MSRTGRARDEVLGRIGELDRFWDRAPADLSYSSSSRG